MPPPPPPPPSQFRILVGAHENIALWQELCFRISVSPPSSSSCEEGVSGISSRTLRMHSLDFPMCCRKSRVGAQRRRRATSILECCRPKSVHKTFSKPRVRLSCACQHRDDGDSSMKVCRQASYPKPSGESKPVGGKSFICGKSSTSDSPSFVPRILRQGP